MFGLIAGLVAAGIYLSIQLKENDGVSGLDTIIALLILLLGWVGLIVAAILFLMDNEEEDWLEDVKSFMIYEKDDFK